MAKFDPIRNFPFWCHKIIPLVYDDSLSYYEFLCKVMQKLNEAIDLLNAHSEEIEKFETDLMALFEAFREEIRQKITDFESMFVEEYDPTVLYSEGDIRSKEGKLYRALTDTTGEFNPEDWLEIIFATDFGEWRKSLNERVIQFMLDVTTKLDSWTSSIASTYDEDTNYSTGDIISHEDLLYIANKNTSGTFDPNDWDNIVLVNWLRDVIRRYDQAIDSVTEIADDCEKRKVAITSAHIYERKQLLRTHTDASATGFIPFEYNLGPETRVTVYVLTLVNANEQIVNAFKSSVDRISIGSAPVFNDVYDKELYWAGNSAYAAFPAYSGTNLVASLHFDNTLSAGIQYKVMKYSVDGLQGGSLPNATHEGLGYVNANDVLMYFKSLIANHTSAINNLQIQDNILSQSLLDIRDTSAKRYLPENGDVNVDTWTGGMDTILSDAYYYHQITPTMWSVGNYVCVTLSECNKALCLGVGTTPTEAFNNQYALREIVTRYGRAVYVPTALIQPTEGQNIYVFSQASDVDPSIGISGNAFISINRANINGTPNGYFSDLPLGIVADWLDGRVSANETQLGGFSLRKVTQSEYDALVTKDPNTWYAIVG
jgi:hypothetical protein